MKGVGVAVAALLVSMEARAGDVGEAAGERDRLGWYAPDYARVQTGGFLGMFTAGLGFSAFDDVLNVGGTYGYVPARDGAPPVHLGSLVVSVRPLRLDFGSHDQFFVRPLYAGFGAFLASMKNSFIVQPDVYPAGYYQPTGLQPLVVFGAEIGVRERGAAILRHSLFVEEVTLGQLAEAVVQNEGHGFVDAFSTALGYRASF
ncbi:MAG: hypothetical protein HYV09_07270 [Deltaproteobacteria bacterium]|nr:hypothetical protein [Deltaproteobacteria bacterium]